MAKFLPQAKISEIHGKPFTVKEKLIVPFYHPAAALHRPSLRGTVEEDFHALPDLIKEVKKVPEIQPVESESQDESPEQLSLF